MAETNRSMQRQANLLSDYQVIQLYDWMVGLDSLNNVTVTDQNKVENKLFNLLSGRTVILYLENGMCEACIKKELLNLNQLVKVVGREKIVLLANGYTFRYLYNSEEFKEWRDRLYQSDDAPTILNSNLSGTPCLLVIDHNFIIRASYHALKSTNKNFEFFLSAFQQTQKGL